MHGEDLQKFWSGHMTGESHSNLSLETRLSHSPTATPLGPLPSISLFSLLPPKTLELRSKVEDDVANAYSRGVA